MKTYMLKRILFSLFSLFVVTGAVMWMTYSLMDREAIFVGDSTINKYVNNEKEIYKYNRYEDYGYIEYVNYTNYLKDKYYAVYGDDYSTNPDYLAGLNSIRDENTYTANVDVQAFTSTYSSKGYEIKFLPGIYKTSGRVVSNPYLLSIKNKNSFERLWEYTTNFFSVETTNDVKDSNLTDRYVRWEWDERSHMPALVGSGTTHKYLIYFDNQFPFIHQNLFHINLGKSNVSYKGVDVTNVLNMNTGRTTFADEEYPTDIGTGVTHHTSLDFHTVTYSASTTAFDEGIYGTGEHYINATQLTSDFTRIGNSFLIGIFAVILSYIFGLPIGTWMARKKDRAVDIIGNVYIIFIMAVPSLAYIFIFAAIGMKFGLPYKWSQATAPWMAFVLPVLSLGLPAMGGLMKWMRRYMIDQSNSDYVKFARSNGMTEGEIFRNHISKNALIYIIHGIPADILFALTGALITEQVYAVPGVGGLLTNAIMVHDNGIIIGGTVFYTFLSILALLLGDVLLAKYDPRVSFTNERG